MSGSVEITARIQEKLFSLQDIKYRDFQIGLIPGQDVSGAIGVRTPALRALAKELSKDPEIDQFLCDVPHTYFDENQLHAFIISGIRDYDKCMAEVTKFLPYIDNWATCDQMSPKVFKKHRTELFSHIEKWIDDEHTYTVRFAIGMLMQHFLDEDFDIKYPEMVAKVRSSEYYINMMIAWYFATALAKQYDEIIPFIEGRRLDVWTHNKTIQKAVESYRISEEKKAYLRTLKIR